MAAIASRRNLLIGFGASLVAAPAIVRAASLMPVRVLITTAPLSEPLTFPEWQDIFLRRIAAALSIPYSLLLETPPYERDLLFSSSS